MCLVMKRYQCQVRLTGGSLDACFLLKASTKLPHISEETSPSSGGTKKNALSHMTKTWLFQKGSTSNLRFSSPTSTPTKQTLPLPPSLIREISAFSDSVTPSDPAPASIKHSTTAVRPRSAAARKGLRPSKSQASCYAIVLTVKNLGWRI